MQKARNVLPGKLRFLLGILPLLPLFGGGCVCVVKGPYRPPPDQTAGVIYVLHRGLHVGVIIRAADIPPGLSPEHREFPRAEYLELGWGDTEGYRSIAGPRGSCCRRCLTQEAACWSSTPSAARSRMNTPALRKKSSRCNSPSRLCTFMPIHPGYVCCRPAGPTNSSSNHIFRRRLFPGYRPLLHREQLQQLDCPVLAHGWLSD